MTDRLLVVEDSPVQAQLLRGHLEAAGYEVRVATDGHAALDQLASDVFDGVVSDVMMPGMGGYELCRRIKEDPQLAATPVVLLTTLGDPVDIVRGLECGADNFITKPYAPEQLLQRVGSVLRSHELRVAGRFRMGVEVMLLGHTFTVDANRQQILDMLMSSFEDLVNTNEQLRQRDEQLRAVDQELRAQVALAEERQHQLEESRYELRHTLEETGVATWQAQLPDGGIEWSDNAHAVLGVAPDTAVDSLEAFLAAVHPEDRDAFMELAQRLPEDPDALPSEWEFRVVGHDGSTRMFSSRGRVTGRVPGDGVSISGVTIDITRRRHLEEELRAREDMLSGFIAASPDGLIVTDREGVVEFASLGMRDLLGMSPEQLIGRHPSEIWSSRAQDALDSAVRETADGDERIDKARFEVVCPDGSTITVDARIRALLDDSGRVRGHVMVLRDATEQAALEAALEAARDEAEAANRAKSEYLSRMSHELRTPMNSVLGFAQLLELSDLEPQDRDSVDRILTAGRHLLQLIDDVLDIARIEAGTVGVSLEPVALHVVVGSAVELIRPQLAERRLSLEVLSASCSEQHVLADQQRLSQVVINLLSNAVKYNSEGGEVTVSCAPAEPGWCRIAVADTGAGISPQDQQRLFTAFDRLAADRTEVKGTGLGLALSKRLVDLMGGRIGCDSAPGQGSTFWVELPEATAMDPEDEHDEDEQEAAVRGGPATATILYIEDNPLNVELVTRALAGRSGTRLLHAPSGEAGLDIVRESPPDLVLLDLQLPGISGREVFRRLRSTAATRDIPIVVLSADATSTSLDDLVAAGADRYLTKPLSLRQLNATIDELLTPAPAVTGDGPASRQGGQ